MIPWEMLITYSYASILGTAFMGVVLTKLLFVVRNRDGRSKPPKPQFVSFDRADQAGDVWRFRLCNMGETAEQNAKVVIVELDDEGSPIRSIRHKTADKWHPNDLIEIDHDCEGVSFATIELRVYFTGPNDLRVRFRQEPIRDLSMVSTEMTTFP